MTRLLVVAVAAAQLGASAPARAEGMVSERTATLASFGGTLVPVAAGIIVGATNPDGFSFEGAAGRIFDAGLLVGPSLGHFYARRSKRALLGIGIRAAGFATAWTAWDGEADVATTALGTLGFGVVVASAMADIHGAKKSARIHNAQVGAPAVSLITRSRMIGLSYRF